MGTSRIERHNWTIRTHLRRLTRLSNGFSRKRSNLRAAMALFFAYYNFVEDGTAGFSYCLEMRNALLEAGGTGNRLGRDTRWLPSRFIPHCHCPRAELQPAHELQVDTIR